MGARGNGIRKGISTVAAIAVVCVVGIAGGVVYLYPSINGGKTNTLTSGTAQSRVGITTSNSTTTYMPPASNTSSSTTAQTGWQTWAVANATLGYAGFRGYIVGAWNYTFNIYQSGANPRQNEFFIANNIFMSDLTVSGNWTTGYTLIYYRTILNVTVQYTPPSNYSPVVFFDAHNLTSIYRSVQFNSTQQKAISLALANASVKSDLSAFPYFVMDAFQFPTGNKTYGGDYLVWIFQSNGPKILGVFVKMASGAIVSTYTSSRVVRTCYSNGVCFSSPWGYS